MKNIILLTLSLLIIACSNGNKSNNVSTKPTPEKPIKLIRIENPQNGSSFAKGNAIQLDIATVDEGLEVDSIVATVNDKTSFKIDGKSTSIQTNDSKLGTLRIKATAWKDGKRQTASVNVFIASDFAPKKMRYRIVKTYEHDPLAYTQGLFYQNGFLYEGTGQNGASSLRKVEISTGKVLQSNNLSQEYFGEGITLLNNKIYQLTWTSGVCFAYDFDTFGNAGTFTYSTQGWGLTSNQTELIMSDGSNVIYFIEPQNFTEVRRIEVYDNNGPVKMLNELEYIDGKIFANVYLTDNIVVIDPETGAVTASIDFSGILKESQRNGNEDVLNGIAYDSQTKRYFVTGKYWSKLFQVEIQ